MNDAAKFGLSVLVGWAIASVFGLGTALALTCLYVIVRSPHVYALCVIFAALRRVRGDRPNMLEKF
jgi:hypothetical protein